MTGASRGIGRAAALALAKSGAHVVALARTQGALEELDDEIRALRPAEPEATTLVPMDLRDFAAIDRLGEALYRRWGRLDAFVGNAGVLGLLTPLHHLDPKTWDDVMAVNVTANWRLIRSLDPLLRRSAAGRVAFITSGAASRAELRAYWGPYATSKAALDALARTYAAETPQHLERPRHAGQSGAAAHADARQRHARRRPDDPARAGRARAEDRRDLLARMDRNGQIVRFSVGSDSQFPVAGLRGEAASLGFGLRREAGRLCMRAASLRPAGG